MTIHVAVRGQTIWRSYFSSHQEDPGFKSQVIERDCRCFIHWTIWLVLHMTLSQGLSASSVWLGRLVLETCLCLPPSPLTARDAAIHSWWAMGLWIQVPRLCSRHLTNWAISWVYSLACSILSSRAWGDLELLLLRQLSPRCCNEIHLFIWCGTGDGTHTRCVALSVR